MRVAIGNSEKWFHQRPHGELALRLFPALRDDLAILIQQQIGQISIVKITRQHCGRCLRVQILRWYAGRRGWMRRAEHKQANRYQRPLGYGSQ